MYYEIKGKSARLLGTMHAFPEGVSTLPDWVESAYKWAETLAIEHSPPELLESGNLEAPHRLHNLVSPETWDGLRNSWSEYPDLPALETLKPWAAMVHLMVRRLGPLAAGVEQVLLAREATLGRAFGFLESGKEVAKLWDEAPPSAWVEVLKTMPLQGEQQRAFRDLYDAWSACSLKRLAAVRPAGGVEMSADLQQLIFQTRNERWAQRIASHDFGSTRTLILVGGLHLVKERNLIECLGNLGLVCTPILATSPLRL
jgi:uncharacterized protein YbaP (TraB family)